MIKMKDSGIPWIGQIPEDWEVAKLKNFTKFYSGGTPNVSNQFNYNDNGVSFVTIKDMSNNYLINKTEKHITKLGIKEKNLKILDKGTVLYSIYATVGEISELNINATINQAILALTNLKNINKTFLKYNLLSMKDFVISLSNGNTQFNLNTEIVKNFYLTTPSFELQQKIVEILDKKCGQIDELVRIEENEIEKLKEYKTSLITKVVTKGLDPNVKMKDSGIPWIGQIPESWITIKIKFTSWLKGRIGWDGLKSSEFKEDGPFLITGTDFNNGNIKWDTCAHITEERFMEDELLHVKEGDLLITKDGTIGKLAIVKNCPEKVSLNSGVMIIRNNSNWKYDNKYLYYILLSNQFYLWYEKSQNGNSTIKHLYQEQFYNFEFSYPNILYQKRIVAYLDNKCEEIDNLIKIKQEKIEKLKEYKKSLIYQYVTGKKEVV